MNLEKDIQRYQDYIESYLPSIYQEFRQEPQQLLFDAERYSLLAGGKRLRPILVFDFCRMSGGDWKQAAPLAAAVEMIHTYSLIHDDLPCMDNDDFRRGRPTNHKMYGEGIAVLAGDGLLTDAFLVASRAKLTAPWSTADAISLLAQCAGSLGMVGGQVLDILSQTRELTEQEVLDIQSRKTGRLIRAACCLGAMAGGATQTQYQAAIRFAEDLGLAFQIRDDMLDVIGTQEEMGKGVGTDGEKNTFVRLYGLEKCENLVKFYTDRGIAALECFRDTEFMSELARSLTQRRK